jgi:thioredoxin-like negative regulator of GroEL
MGILTNLFSRLLFDRKLPTFHKLTSDTYGDFIKRSEFAIVLFHATWDVGGAKAIRPLLQSVSETQGDQAQFAEVDVDEHQDIPASIQLIQVPAIAYYRRGDLIEVVGGAPQDISAHVAALLAGEKEG